jgi:hypothetical protein
VWKNLGITFSDWFNGDDPNFLLALVVGLSSNIVFGAIDNGGMFFGSSFLDEWFQLLPGSDDANVFAGYGNTYSNLLGTFMGTFVGLIMEDMTKVSSTPIWGDAIGIIFGCLIGIAIPKAILSSSETSGINRVHTNAAFIGDLTDNQLQLLINGESSILE